MKSNDVLTAIKFFLRRHRREIELVALGALLSGVGVLAALALSSSDRRGIEIIDADTQSTLNAQRSTLASPSLTVDVAGAVINPGVFRLPANSRFADALAAAGGLAAGADRDWVSQNINLAQNVTDGGKIYIPALGENYGHPKRSEGSRRDSSSPSVPQNDAAISINSATLIELDSLWGVGESRAQAIITGRPYQSIEELVSRKILPKNVVERNRDRLRL